ncbi:cytochrome C [Geoanaerobacter pelophilus]|uniref:Cytochrome C n=1 Tax=Geoanaerobacter pelophilus TaxID=60036 RepID=A0ABQ0MLC4_9BACT|nr:cytochrome c3 family protein [Geoanaerobacter pelophilus]GAW67854.1 cytochrome C [Geoanaerobacter pelophilus]
MVKVGKVQVALVLSVAIAIVGIASLLPTQANLAHQTRASGILTAEECLACHSGAASRKPVSICLTDHCLYTNEHPVLRPYPPYGKDFDFASVAEITEAGCVLQDGKITCLSCHDLTKPPPHLIKKGDQLCYLCHKSLRAGW